jgi:DNA-binding NtrC family response regulator
MLWNMMELAWIVKTTWTAPQSVLVVEDDTSLRRPLASTLYDVHPDLSLKWVTTVPDAKESIQMYEPGLIIADCLLDGDGTGLQLWEYCLKHHPRVPFMLMTGLSQDDLWRLKPKSTSGLPIVLRKPFRPIEYKRALIDALI